MSQIIPDATVKTYLNQVKLKLRWFNSRNLTCHLLSTQSPKLYLKYLTLKSTDGFPESRLCFSSNDWPDPIPALFFYLRLPWKMLLDLRVGSKLLFLAFNQSRAIF